MSGTAHAVALTPTGLQGVLDALAARGFQCLGPRLDGSAIACGPIASVADLPAGWTARQEPGRYRLERRGDGALFGYAVGPQSWKRWLLPPQLTLWRACAGGPTALRIEAVPDDGDTAPLAFIGVRPCELAALAAQDGVLAEGAHVDPVYAGRRRAAFLVAVECGEPGGTCFCTSMGTGPGVVDGSWDIALTEVVDATQHVLVARAGTAAGREVLDAALAPPASAAQRAAAVATVADARAHMGRTLATDGLAAKLAVSYASPHWDDVARRCLGCANCTLACPTCFCHTVADVTDLGGAAERVRRWDSCFSLDFSYIHGGSLRTTPAARYRQWLIHKLGTWHAQFGRSGCVGCGRCITWCPVGIDITAEAAALAGAAANQAGLP